MTYDIRHACDEDVPAVHDILLSEHVLDGTMRLPYQPLSYTQTRLAPENGIFKLVALDEARVVGFSELITYPNAPRQRHAGEINMIVTHPDWLGKGVGAALMAAMLSLADDWLRLKRVGLVVWVGNDSAVRLYERFGFVIEGTMPAYVFRRGAYIDAYHMGRVLLDRS